MQQHVIGLTGGIATGKTTIAQTIAQDYDLTILDADCYAREAVAVGSPILTKIIDRYGSNLLVADGSLNRTRLGQIIFANDVERHWLEAQIHPFVRQRFEDDRPSASDPLIYVVPLLFETNAITLVDETWVVWCPPEEQIARLMKRDRIDEEAARQRIAAQWPLQVKCDRADLVLDNGGDRHHWREQVRNRLG